MLGRKMNKDSFMMKCLLFLRERGKYFKQVKQMYRIYYGLFVNCHFYSSPVVSFTNNREIYTGTPRNYHNNLNLIFLSNSVVTLVFRVLQSVDYADSSQV